MRILKAAVLTALVCGAVALKAQTVQGSIRGTAADAAAKVLPGVTVTLTHEDTNRKRTTVTDAHGNFALPSLPPGAYRIDAEKAGYRAQTLRIELQVNQDVRVDLPLAASVAQSVEVTATPLLLRTETAAVGAVIENRLIQTLPLDGRNFYELSLLVPGAFPGAQGSAGSVRGDLSLSINGAREDSNNYLLDGVYSGDPKLNAFGIRPPLDAVREFEVLASTYDASFGRYAGGQINVVTRTGSNALHGALYEFLRNDKLDARNFFAPRREQNQRNQFGGVLGGPIRRDRTFFFGDYEGLRAREGLTRITNVPSAAERAGDFSQSFAAPVNFLTGQPFPGNRIPREFQHPIGAAIANLFPLPNRAVPGQNFIGTVARRDRDDHFDVRLDHALTAADELAFRYSFADRDLYEPFSGPSYALVPGFGTNVPRRAQNAMVAYTRAFSPAFLNELRLGFNRVAGGSFHENMGGSINRTLGLPELSRNERDFGLSFITVTGYSPLGDEFNNPQHSVTNSYQLVEQANWTRGRHSLKFGGDLRTVQQNAFRDVQARGFLTFLGAFTQNPLADLLLGLPTITGGARLDNHQHLRTEGYHFFAQDSFRPRSDVVVSFGLRYEFNSPPVDADDRANTFDSVRHALVRVGTEGVPRAGYRADRNNFAPRVGVTWAPGGRSTVLRAGYGLYYDQSALAPGEGLYFNAPYFDFRLFFPVPEANFFLRVDDPFPAQFPIALPSSALAFDRDLRSAYLQHWNVGVQQQFGKSRVLEVAYVGSKGTRLLGARDINQPRPSPARPNLRPDPRFDDINLIESRGNSSYNSLQVRLQQRMAAGLSLLAAYTFAKSLDDGSSFFSSAGDPNYPQDSMNLRGERGRSNFDARHRLSFSYAWDLPLGKRGAWLSGWQTTGIWTLQSGRPFTVALLPDLDQSNTGRSILGFGANDRPNVLRDPQLSDRRPERWFDTSAFALPAFGNFGNAGRNALEGPGLFTANIAVLKNTSLTERANLQFRAEFFNLFNRVNFDLPDIFYGSPTFGRVLSAQNPRRVQLGIKLLF